MILVKIWLCRAKISGYENLTFTQINAVRAPHIYKLLKTAAAHSDFTKFLRWPLVSDNNLNTVPQSKD